MPTAAADCVLERHDVAGLRGRAKVIRETQFAVEVRRPVLGHLCDVGANTRAAAIEDESHSALPLPPTLVVPIEGDSEEVERGARSELAVAEIATRLGV